MKIFKEALRKNRRVLILTLVMSVCNAGIFALYDIFFEPFIYVTILAFILILVMITLGFFAEKKKSAYREAVITGIGNDWKDLPEAETLAEEDYRKMILALGEHMDRLIEECDSDRQDMLDYYTAWVHQIKTPIAVMRLKLSDDTPENHALLVELSRIEQYVEMVLQYIRLGSDTNDLVIREYPLDQLICESLRKMAPQFIEKKLSIKYDKTDEIIVTDEKWFTCILEQLLTNAVKYTPSGTVTINVHDSVLKVSDTGIGIAAEDLPRIFEKGYTGINGRIEKKSSGLGLYLAKKAADLLSISLSAESTLGKGSTFIADFHQERVR